MNRLHVPVDVRDCGAVGVEDVFIRGGMIDGDYTKFYVRDYFYGCGGRRFLTPATKKGDPAQLVWFHECANVTVENLLE